MGDNSVTQVNTRHLVWLITGTSSGFGRRLVASCLNRGDSVIATARSVEKLENLRTLSSDPSRLRFLQLDVTDNFETIKARVDEAIAIWGQVDVVVNNAGIGIPSLVEESGAEGLIAQYETNVFGVAKVNSAILPHMRDRRSGTVVIIGSRSAWKPEVSGLGLYASSKAAVHAMGETLSHELAPFSVQVLIVEPGAFRTENIYNQLWFHHNAHRQPSLDAYRSECETKWYLTPGRQPGDPDKAMEMVVDVVRGEGVAQGREWPLYLVLGEDAERDIRTKCGKVLKVLDQWQDVTRATSLQPEVG
ncbi:hypothetical protein JAAARDRAFT_38954 [Jaapia argillacea MUCL 33604]|uniref:Uncharacterized protein n=1 Tax=Jaapia argillacea MUCL 33604 TaxID=933084 RepID=A0A067PJG7_9AGAM|nr:hypothetical protein JAAARDRAFT_38954 [Jaapia argillacea MUCL 33604]